MLILLLCGLASAPLTLGCGGDSRDRYLPSSQAAREILDKSLQKWKSGTPHGPIADAKPVINIFDARWQEGKKLKFYEIIEEEKYTDQPQFKVRLQVEGEPEETTIYYVIGIDPIQVYRETEFLQSSQTM
jgi:hypothetical protein